jgi:hypothetical protein
MLLCFVGDGIHHVQRTLSQELLGKARGILCTDSISTILGHPAASKNQTIHKESGSGRLTKCQGDWDIMIRANYDEAYTPAHLYYDQGWARW